MITGKWYLFKVAHIVMMFIVNAGKACNAQATKIYNTRKAQKINIRTNPTTIISANNCLVKQIAYNSTE